MFAKFNQGSVGGRGMKIRNYSSLIQKSDREARKKVLDLMNKVLEHVDAGDIIRSIMSLNGDVLRVGKRTWDLSKKDRIFLIGSGKACNAMAGAVCDILGERITKGIISVKIPEVQDCYVNTDVYVGGHPLPNEEGMLAAQRMIELIEGATERDLFISVISGGSSALLAYPVEGITLEDEIRAHDLLLKSGATITEINAVRRHISRTNGGRLAELITGKGAELISLMVGDAVGRLPTQDIGEPVDFYGTPVGPDNTTIEDARSMIKNYDLDEKLPKRIVDYIFDDERVRETPKKFASLLTTFLLATVSDLGEAAIRAAGEMGIPILVLSTFLEGESRDAGRVLSSVAREIKYLKRPITPPCFVVLAGETTTSITEPAAGKGGPSHELTLGFAIGIKGIDGIACASIDTEGTDGTTLNAGGLVDGQTYKRLADAGINIYEALRNHTSGDALEAIGDHIFTGNTGTNLCDFNVIYIA